jgi:uncharacterized protein (DUF433 family)
MEMKFIKFFEDANLKPSYIRSIFEEVRRSLRQPHPFATNEVFRTDGRKIMEEIVSSSGKVLYDLKTKNYEMRNVVLDTLMEDVVYDARGVARAWYPRKRIAPDVIVNPNFSFGRPVLRDSAIPTRTIADAFRTEKNVKRVSDWYDISQKHVREAVRFEEALRQAA